ncbi:MAG: HlyD family efflux transporter periplasmic adaptor subunit [Planctomycetota bacterium]
MIDAVSSTPSLLRADLQMIDLGASETVLRDRATGTHFRFGDEERILIQWFDEGLRLTEIRRRYLEKYGQKLSRRHVREFAEQLSALGLTATKNAPATSGSATLPADEATIPMPWSTEDPVARLNHGFDLLLLTLGWLLHPVVLLPIIALAILAGMGFVERADRFAEELVEMARPSTLRFLLLVLLCRLFCLNLPREILMAMAARQSGGRVRGFEFKLVYGFLPTVQIAVEDAALAPDGRGPWRLLTIRFWTTLAIASLAMAGWLVADSGSIIGAFCLVLIVPALVGTAMHFNVFMPLDGYLVLSSWLRVPRLIERATSHTAAWLSLRWAPEPLTPDERFWFRIYGVLVYLWRLVAVIAIVGGLGWILVAREGRLGALIVTGLLAVRCGDLIRRSAMGNKPIKWAVRTGGRWWIRWPLRLVVLGALIACGFIPYSHEVSGECRLVPQAEVGLRAEIAGRVQTVHVAEGTHVEEGDVVVTLAAREEKGRVEVSRAQLAKARAELALLKAGSRPEEIAMATEQLKLRQIESELASVEFKRLTRIAETGAANDLELSRAKEEHDSAEQVVRISREYLQRVEKGARDEEIQIAEAEVERLEAQLAHDEEMYSLREIRAPIAGRVVTPNIEQRLGQYVFPGDLLAVIHDTSRLRVQMVVPDAGAPYAKPGARVKVRFWALDGELLGGRVQSVSSYAADYTELNVERIRSDREILLEDAVRADEDRYVRAYIELNATDLPLRPGMKGYARIIVNKEFLWHSLARPLVRFARVEVWSWLP